MNQKEEIKAEKKLILDSIKEALKDFGGVISEIQLSDVDIPKLRLTGNRAVEDTFNKQKEMFYNKEHAKLCTELKNCALKIGRHAFELQASLCADKKDLEVRNEKFTSAETIQAYKKVIEMLYYDIKPVKAQSEPVLF